MNREDLDRGLQIGIACLVAAMLVFGPLAFGAVRASEFILVQWLTVGILVLWAFRLWLAPKFRFLWPPTCWAILPFLAYAAWRYKTADVQYAAHSEFIQILVLGCVFLACVNNLYGRADLRRVGAVVVALATVLAMHGIYQT